MKKISKKHNEKDALKRIQDFFGIKEKRIFLAFAAITIFVIAYSLFTITQQVHPSNWFYTENFEENWMRTDFNDSNWSRIQLPFLEVGKQGVVAYYRGDIELSGFLKPDLVIGAQSNLLEVYLNDERIVNYTTKKIENSDEIVLSHSLFKTGKNTLALKLGGGGYRILSLSTKEKAPIWPVGLTGLFNPIITGDNSIVSLLLFVIPAILFMVIGRKYLDSNKIAFVLFLVFSLVFLKPILQDFNYWGLHDWGMDQAINAVQRATIFDFHQIPLWTPYLSGGQPVIADPHSTLMSPLFIFILIFNVITGLKIRIVFMYLIGLFGMYLLGKQLNLKIYAKYVMSFIFVLSSFLSLHLSEGHDSFMLVSIMPWVFLFYLKALESKVYAIASAVAIAIILFSGGAHILVYTVLLLGAYAIFTSAQKVMSRESKKEVINPILTFLAIGVLAFSIGAIKAMPLIELSLKYPRLTEGDRLLYDGYSKNTLYYALLGTLQTRFAPDQLADFRSDWYEFGAYIGPIALILALGGVILNFRRLWPLALVILLGVLLSFGRTQSEMFLWNLLHKLPVLSSLRSPSRAIIIALLPLSIFAGYMVSKIEEKRKWLAIILTMLVFYNLLTVNSVTLTETFSNAPRTLDKETRFTQVVDKPQKILVYSESYKHFLQNQGTVNSGSLLWLSRGAYAANPSSSQDYHEEVFLASYSGNASFTSFSPNRLAITVSAKSNDILVVNQNFDASWKSPGKEVYSKNGLIALNVTAEDREVLLYYSPDSFKIGLAITLLTILLIVHYIKDAKESNNKTNIKKFLKKIKYGEIAIYAMAIIILSTYGVDFIQSSGLYTEKQTLINGPEYQVPNAIKSGIWIATKMGHDVGGVAQDGSWESGNGRSGYMISGPYVSIGKGRYNVTLRMKVEGNIEEKVKIVDLDVSRDRGAILVSKSLSMKDFDEVGKYQDFTLIIDSKRDLLDVEFRAYYEKGPAIVSIDTITLKSS